MPYRAAMEVRVSPGRMRWTTRSRSSAAGASRRTRLTLGPGGTGMMSSVPTRSRLCSAIPFASATSRAETPFVRAMLPRVWPRWTLCTR